MAWVDTEIDRERERVRRSDVARLAEGGSENRSSLSLAHVFLLDSKVEIHARAPPDLGGAQLDSDLRAVHLIGACSFLLSCGYEYLLARFLSASPGSKMKSGSG